MINQAHKGGMVFLFLGAGFFGIFFIIHKPALLSQIMAWSFTAPLLWCTSLSCVGIAAGIINNSDKPRSFFHYLFYDGFILIIMVTASFTAGLYLSGEPPNDPQVKFFSLSTLIALILGFLEDNFHALAMRLFRLEKN